MEKREPVIKILYENTTRPVNRVLLIFPLSGREKPEQKMLALTRGHEGKSSISFRIAKVESPIPGLDRYLPADGWFQEISCLAEKIGRMDREEQMKFSGILDCRSISTIGDVLEAADSLQLYECFPGVTCSRELGGYVVENGIMEFPRKVWPYLDYRGIGEEYYASHSCAYTQTGLVVRKEEAPEIEMLCLNSRENFKENKSFLRKRAEEERNPVVRRSWSVTRISWTGSRCRWPQPENS